jgi:hypothetical protein
MRVLPHFRKNQLVAVHRFTFGTRECCKLLIFIVLVLALPARALSQWIDEGEFSQAVLSYKLCQLKTQFEQADAELSMRRGESKLKKLELEDVYRRIIRLESEFQRGGYYPDLLDEQIVILREDLRLILADPGQTGITEPLLL